jgi:hypothetical protein
MSSIYFKAVDPKANEGVFVLDYTLDAEVTKLIVSNIPPESDFYTGLRKLPKLRYYLVANDNGKLTFESDTLSEPGQPDKIVLLYVNRDIGHIGYAIGPLAGDSKMTAERLSQTTFVSYRGNFWVQRMYAVDLTQ